MSKARKAAKALFGLAVAGALVFGATEARATARTACTINYEYGRLGACATHDECDLRCKSTYGPESGGACFSGCCRCAL